jgi:hypothetical protein
MAIPSLKIWRAAFERKNDCRKTFIKTPREEFATRTVGVYQSPGDRSAWQTERLAIGKMNLAWFIFVIPQW